MHSLSDEPAAADALLQFEGLAGAAVRNRQFAVAPINEVKARLAEAGAEVGDGPSTAVDHSASAFQLKPLVIGAASVELIVVGLLRRVTASPHGSVACDARVRGSGHDRPGLGPA